LLVWPWLMPINYVIIGLISGAASLAIIDERKVFEEINFSLVRIGGRDPCLFAFDQASTLA
jgi:hypothetical protein